MKEIRSKSRIILSCIMLLCTSLTVYAQLSLSKFPDDKIMVVAHRADWREAPENSIQAIKKAIEKGVNMVEIDLALTKDNILILMHDKTIDRTTTGKGNPGDYTLEEIKKLSLKDGLGVPTEMKIPTLQEVLDVTEGKIFINLDKAFDYFDIVYPMLKERKMFDQVLFKGTANYDEFNKKYGKIKNEIHYMPIIRLAGGEGWPKINGYLKNYRVYGFEFTTGHDEKHLINFQELRKNKIKIWMNSMWAELCARHNDDQLFENPEVYSWYPDHDVNMIQTDRPKELIDFLKKKNLYHFIP